MPQVPGVYWGVVVCYLNSEFVTIRNLFAENVIICTKYTINQEVKQYVTCYIHV